MKKLTRWILLLACLSTFNGCFDNVEEPDPKPPTPPPTQQIDDTSIKA